MLILNKDTYDWPEFTVQSRAITGESDSTTVPGSKAGRVAHIRVTGGAVTSVVLSVPGKPLSWWPSRYNAVPELR
jgi:hypothetical protein